MISDDAFANMVAEEVKNKLSNKQRLQLLEKENWERWKETLLVLAEKLQEQIEQIEYDSEADRIRY